MDPNALGVRPPRRLSRLAAALLMLGVVASVILYQGTYVDSLLSDPFFVGYAVLVSTYLLSRFVLSMAYRPTKTGPQDRTVSVVVAAFNEEENIERTIEALLAVDYPRQLLDIVVVDDGSTDGTLQATTRAAQLDARVTVVSFSHNRGKRHAMAAGFEASRGEIVAFIDSDSVVSPDGIREIIKPFEDGRVGAVCGHAEAVNVRSTWMTRMQAVRYFVAFRVVKAAESLFGAVSCCSGCFSAYRRSAIEPYMGRWLNQRYLGAHCTYGDDRSLTNYVLKDHRVMYQSTATVATIVPENFKQFLSQQMRWKRSWTRESPRLAVFAWRKNFIAALFTYIGIALTLVSPIAAIRCLAWRPLVSGGGTPTMYVLGLAAMALIYGLYYATRKGFRGQLWLYGIGFIFFYVTVLLWQQYWAIVTSRRTSWGTRASTHSAEEAQIQVSRPGLPPPPEFLSPLAPPTTLGEAA